MGLKEVKLFQGNSVIQFFSVFLALYLVFLTVMRSVSSSPGLTSLGSLARLLASVVLLAQVFMQGERKGIFSRYFSYSDILCFVAGTSIGFFAGYSFVKVAFSDPSLYFSPVLLGFFDVTLAFLLLLQVFSE